MSKFCFNCGNELPDDAVFCAGCGSKLADVTEEIATQAEESVAQATSIPQDTAAPAPKKRSKKALLFTLIPLILVVAVVAYIFFGQPYKKPIDTLFDVTYREEFDKLEDLAPQEYWDWYEEKYDKDVDDLIESYKEDFNESKAKIEETYGDNFKVRFRILDKEKLDEDKLDDIRDGLDNNYGISKKSVKRAYLVGIKITLKGDDQTDYIYGGMIVTQIGNKWYATSSEGTLILK